MAKLISSQIEQLQEIGAYLRQVRQEQGLDIEAIANQIFIRPTLLRSLEAGTDEHLPEPVFVQGFIRRYGDALGVDGQALAEKFSVTPVAVLSSPREMPARSARPPIEPEARSLPATPPESFNPSRRSAPWGLLVGVGVFGVMLFLLVWGMTSRRPQPAVELPTEEEPAAPSPAPAPVVEAEPVEPEPEAAPEAPVVAVVNLSDRAWMSVTVDGSNVFEGIMEGGSEETWTAQNSIVITSGNAGGVELAVNGGEAARMGAPGTVQTVTLTPETGSQDPSQATAE